MHSDKLLLTACRVVTHTGVIDNAAITIGGGRITAVGAGEVSGGDTLDLGGLTVLPGFIDLHIHGAGGADAHAGEIAELAAFLPRCGVTAFLPTLAAGDETRTLAALRAIGAARAAQEAGEIGGARVLGAHLEGPFLNPARAGAIPPEHMHPPDPARADRLLAAVPGLVRLMTLAPELPGALDLSADLARRGIVVSLGHTGADAATTRRALDAGARHATHLFNAMVGLHHRAPGVAGVMLTDPRATVELIADGEHVDPAILALAIRARGAGRVALVSDAVGPAGLPPGEYAWFGRAVTSDGDTARLPDGTLAGSLGTLDRALRLVTTPAPAGCDVALADAAQMLAATPARILDLRDRGRIAAGSPADLTVVDDAGRIRLTLIAGKIAHDAR